MNKEELKEILDSHKKWINNEQGGKKADLRFAELRDADLRDADLRDADLRGADLRDADLRFADLSFADLRGADLRGANLRGADLWIVSGDDYVWAIVRAELERRIAEDRMRQSHENAD